MKLTKEALTKMVKEVIQEQMKEEGMNEWSPKFSKGPRGQHLKKLAKAAKMFYKLHSDILTAPQFDKGFFFLHQKTFPKGPIPSVASLKKELKQILIQCGLPDVALRISNKDNWGTDPDKVGPLFVSISPSF